MSHNISIRKDGTAEAMYAYKPAWHNLGSVVSHAPTSEDAIRLAGLDWQVEKWPVLAHSPNGDVVPLDDTYATVRNDTHDTLGTVGKSYDIFQNEEGFSFLDNLVQDGVIRYEAAGALGKGERVWLLARMPKEFVLGDDDAIAPYILFATSHDGTMAVRVLPTAVRVVCQNTLSMALGSGNKDKELKIAHKGNLDARVSEARRKLNIAESKFELLMSQAEGLANVSIDQSTFNDYLYQLYPDPKDGNGNPKKSKRSQNIRNEIRRVSGNATNNTDPARGTYWGAYNAVSEYVDHVMTIRNKDRDPSNRMRTLLFDHGARMKQKALETACEMAGVEG